MLLCLVYFLLMLLCLVYFLLMLLCLVLGFDVSNNILTDFSVLSIWFIETAVCHLSSTISEPVLSTLYQNVLVSQFVSVVFS